MAASARTDLRSWLTDSLLPDWIVRAYDPARPGFVEYLAPDGKPELGEIRTTLVTARLTYVFSHAHLLGVPGALAAARHGMDFLTGALRQPDGCFVHSCGTTPVIALVLSLRPCLVIVSSSQRTNHVRAGGHTLFSTITKKHFTERPHHGGGSNVQCAFHRINLI